MRHRSCGALFLCLALGLAAPVLGQGRGAVPPAQPGVTPWERGPDLPLGRVGAAAAWIGGRFVVAGGSYWRDGTKHWSDRVDAYDPANRRWESLPEIPVRLSNSGHTAAGDRLYLIGGVSDGKPTAQVRRLTHAAGTWSWDELPPLPAPGLYGAAGIDGDLLCYAGGTADPIDLRQVTRAVWRLDLRKPEQGWKSGAEVPGRARCLGGYATVKGDLHFLGGCAGIDETHVENLAEAARYDISGNRWTRMKPLPRGIRAAAAAMLPDGRIALIGGHSAGPHDGERYGLAWGFERRILLLDPRRERWSEGAPLLEPVVDPPVGVYQDRLYLAGGEDRARSRTALMASAPVSGIAQPATTRPIWVCLGDSVTHGVGRSGVTDEQTYPRALEKLAFPLNPSPWVVNGGKGGETTKAAIERLPSLLKPLPRVDVLVLMYGLNDASLVDGGPKARTGPRVELADYRANLQALIAEGRRNGARVILCTPNPMTQRYPYARFGEYARHPDINFLLKDFVAAARTLAKEEKVPLADVYNAFTRRKKWEDLLPDGIHPNAEGLAHLAAEVAKAAGVPRPEPASP